MADQNNSSPQQKRIEVLEVVGCFLMFFGVLLLIAVFGRETVSGRMTNLLSALILLAIGIGMFWRGVVAHRRGWLLPVVLFASLAAVSVVVSLCLSPEAYSVVVGALRQAGWAMRHVVEGIPPTWVKILTVVGFLAIAAVVWLVRRETVFEGVTDRKWWRDPRVWTGVIIATQIVIYILLGT